MKRSLSARILFWAAVTVIALVTLFPFYWTVRTALTFPRAVYSHPTAFLPPQLTIGNFERVLGLVDAATSVKLGGSGQTINFFVFLRNSIVVSALITMGQTFFSAAAAYAFARLRFPLNRQIFGFYLSALMVPGIVLLIPNFILIKTLGWLNTYQGIAAPAFLMSPFAVFFMRQFFLGMNKELEEAALVEGAGRVRIFFQIAVPLSMTALTTLAVITFIYSWNDYLWPLLVGRSESVRMLTVALGVFRQQGAQNLPDWAGLMAGTTLAILPTLVLFLALGKRVINSIGFTGFR
ncbi:MAG TPA: carbohydrate ABC transporter permease [Spirochaetia bacterium]|nr:carbohydrate ABC transporter permease [Spirochaetia bacterium]